MCNKNYPKLSEMIESVERNRTYQDFCDKVDNLENSGDYEYLRVETNHLKFLKLLQGILYREYNLSADTQRDLAHKLGAILTDIIPE